MNLDDLLRRQEIDPTRTIVLRHRPFEPQLNRVLPWLAADRPDLFEAFQKTHGARLESAMVGASHVVSCIRYRAGEALFIGLYSINGARPITLADYWGIPEHSELKSLGMIGFTAAENRSTILLFDLTYQEEFYGAWKGKLILGWPPPERSWWRRAHRNEFPVRAVLEESALNTSMPDWHELNLTWDEIKVLPLRWRSALSHWRGVYYIFDVSDAKGYVGSAYGTENLLGRWINYEKSGHGGNSLLRKRDPTNFRFTILQRVSPDLDSADVIGIENSWKHRLHTRAPFGLNEN